MEASARLICALMEDGEVRTVHRIMADLAARGTPLALRSVTYIVAALLVERQLMRWGRQVNPAGGVAAAYRYLPPKPDLPLSTLVARGLALEAAHRAKGVRGEVVLEVARCLGLGSAIYRRAKCIVQAAQHDRARYGDLLVALDGGGATIRCGDRLVAVGGATINSLYTELRRRQQQQEAEGTDAPRVVGRTRRHRAA